MKIAYREMQLEDVRKFYAERRYGTRDSYIEPRRYRINDIYEWTFTSGRPGFVVDGKLPLDVNRRRYGIPKRWVLGENGEPVDPLKPLWLDSRWNLCWHRIQYFGEFYEHRIDVLCGYFDEENHILMVTPIDYASELYCFDYYFGEYYTNDLMTYPVNDASEIWYSEAFERLKGCANLQRKDYARGYEQYIAKHKPYLPQYIESFEEINQLLKENHKNLIIDYETTDERFYLRSAPPDLLRKIRCGVFFTNYCHNWQQHCPIINEYVCEELELGRLLKDAKAYLKD